MIIIIIIIQGGPEKIAQSLMHPHLATIRCNITWFAPKWSVKITVCQSMQNFCQLDKYSLINRRNCIRHHWCHPLVSRTPLTGEDWLLFQTSLSRQNGSLTHLIWIPWITQFGVLFSSWYIVRRPRTLTVQNKSWTVAETWSSKN